MAIMLRHLNDPIPPLLVAHADLDPALGDWVARMLAKKPPERPASAAQAAEELDRSRSELSALAGDARADSPRNGMAVAVWPNVHDDPRTGVVEDVAVEGAVFEVDRGWLPVAALGEGGRPGPVYPRAAADAGGNALVVWSSQAGLQAAALDSSGPQLRSLRVPARGRVGQQLRFSVLPVDTWSEIASTTWSFGDGRNVGCDACGAYHAYKKPGRYTVTVTASDTLGNRTSATRTVRISRRRL